MKVLERNVMRLVAVQELRTAYGIKTKNWNKNKAAKVFGVSLDSLPCYNMECGSVPGFLVDSCMKLQAHVDTEGLFRKSGSVVRLKALRAKLEVGEECLSSALPCDVAGLVKQFFRELPEPVLPTELQDAFLKAQQLPTDQDRTAATMLLTCVLPDKNICVLHYFFDFLRNVSLRSAENKMNSSNLSVILAPNLLHFGEGAEKMNANTEKRLRLQAAIVQCFIENADNFGVLPDFLQEKVPAMMGYEGGVLTPTHDSEELDFNFGTKRKHRRSFGDVISGALNKIKTNRTPTKVNQADSLVFSSATHVIATPSSKRKPPLESAQSLGFSNKKRRSVKKNLGLELLSNTLFSGNSTPASAYSASGVLDSSSSSVLSAGRSRRQTAASGSRKSKRRSGRNVINRVESGRSGCFSPKVSKKEAPRKSMRLRFSLGKSSKDAVSPRLIDALDIQSPARFKHHVSSGPQSTPYKPGVETKDERFVVSHERSGISKPVQNQQAMSPQKQPNRKARVADHIQHFNKLTLYSPPGSKTNQIRSPLKFQRTPVRQTVCRINSLLGDSRRPRNNAVFGVGQSPRVAKTVSLESGLSPHPQPQQRRPQTRLLNSRTTVKNPPPVPPKKLGTLDRIPKSCALGDVTNKAQQKTKVESSSSTPSEAQKLLLQQVAEKDTPHYRGSPRNPLNQGNLLSAMKPIDL
uniref:Rho GTPase activating protein 11A n=1 Tax=Oryzias sinensis TaxID=183150 RepID=A0A8C7XIL9_9TELE